MALNNAQYDTIMRDYQRRQSQHRHEQSDRIQDAYAKLPRLAEIDSEVASASVACGRKLLAGDDAALNLLKDRIHQLSEERTAILTSSGYPADYLELAYTCPLCRDTGYIGDQKCQCFKKAEIDLLYTQSNLQGILDRENFSHFSFDYYSDQITDPTGKVTSLDRITHAVKICHEFVDQFDTSFHNLLFYGDTGVGKTFLSHCIARELLDSTHSVIYFSAQELFERFAQIRFSRNSETSDTADHIYDCDLLIIDDLGTELTNSFVNAELFSCINERLINQKSTIISTNLSLDAIASSYSERIFSRISNGYTMLKLFGKDIRVQKRLQQISDKKNLKK